MSVIADDLAGHAEAVILEAVSNAVRYSGATHLRLEVTVADELDITITDDGCGISPDNQHRQRPGQHGITRGTDRRRLPPHTTSSRRHTEVHWTRSAAGPVTPTATGQSRSRLGRFREWIYHSAANDSEEFR